MKRVIIIVGIIGVIGIIGSVSLIGHAVTNYQIRHRANSQPRDAISAVQLDITSVTSSRSVGCRGGTVRELRIAYGHKQAAGCPMAPQIKVSQK